MKSRYDLDVFLTEIGVQIRLYQEVAKEKIEAALSKYILECPSLKYDEPRIDENGKMRDRPLFYFTFNEPDKMNELETDEDVDKLCDQLLDVSYRLLKDLGINVYPKYDELNEVTRDSYRFPYGIIIDTFYSGSESWVHKGHPFEN